MSNTSENTLEQTTLSWFESLGWQTAFGPNIRPDCLSCVRRDYDQVALRDTTRPMGVATYRALPRKLKRELPTARQIEKGIGKT